MSDVRPRTDDLKRLSRFILDDLERVLDPDVVAVSVPEPVFDCAATLLDQRTHLVEYATGCTRG